jgi:hypothetical protein
LEMEQGLGECVLRLRLAGGSACPTQFW